MKHKVLQWVVSKQREYDSLYLQEHLELTDICVLSRCPKSFLQVVQNKYPHVFYKEHSKDHYIVIGSNLNFKNPEHELLPSNDKAWQTNDRNQGSVLMTVQFDNFRLVTFIAVYEWKYYEYGQGQHGMEISEQEMYQDLSTVFSRIKHDGHEYTDKNLLLVGDIHEEPVPPPQLAKIIDQANLKDHTEGMITFHDIDQEPLIMKGKRHDRIFTRGSLDTTNVQSHCKKTDGGAHWIITYNIIS